MFRVYKYLLGLSKKKLVCTGLLWMGVSFLSLSILKSTFSVLIMGSGKNIDDAREALSKPHNWLITTVVTPIVETFLLQVIPIYLVKLIYPKKNILAILISALIFSLAHNFNFLSIKIIHGFLFALMLEVATKKNFIWGVQSVIITHSIWNIMGLVSFYLLLLII